MVTPRPRKRVEAPSRNPVGRIGELDPSAMPAARKCERARRKRRAQDAQQRVCSSSQGRLILTRAAISGGGSMVARAARQMEHSSVMRG